MEPSPTHLYCSPSWCQLKGDKGHKKKTETRTKKEHKNTIKNSKKATKNAIHRKGIKNSQKKSDKNDIKYIYNEKKGDKKPNKRIKA